MDTTPAPSICKIDTPELVRLRTEQGIALATGSCVLEKIIPHSKSLASSRKKKNKLQRPIMLPKG